jgi:hypothetical protein
MKYVILIVMVLVTQNVLAQPADPSAEPAAGQAPSDPGTPPEPPPDPRTQQCIANGINTCCGGLTACQNVQAQLGQERREQMNTAANAYGESPEQYGRRLCRSIGGTWGDLWDGNDWHTNCECHQPRQWDTNHEFCLPSNAAYLERLCTETGGRWTGGNCDCQGKHLEGGRCTGQNRIEALTGQLATAQATAHTLGGQLETANANLETARTTGTAQASQITALDGQRDTLQRQLNEALQRIAYLQGRLEAEGVSVPPPPPPETAPPGTTAETPPGTTETAPGAIPGAVAAAAEVAVESTQPPVGQVPLAEEEDETSCGGWCIAGIVAGALVVGLGTYLAVELSTSYHLVQ